MSRSSPGRSIVLLAAAALLGGDSAAARISPRSSPTPCRASSAGWTYGILANHIWEISKDESPRPTVDATFLQPFLNHTWRNGFGITVNTESTYDWEGHQWTVPINLFLSQVLALGGQRFSVQAGGRHYAETAPGGPDWGLRLALVLLLPR